MKLSRSVSYAIGILLRIEQQGKGEPITAAKIAKGCKFPPRFLYRILRRLVDAGLLVGVSGPGGGYKLSRPAKEITLYDVVEAIDGPFEPSDLEAVHRNQKAAIKFINELTAKSAATSERQLRAVKLSRLAKM